MRILWTLFKVIVGLSVVIPLGIVALALTLGVVGTVVRLAVVVVKLACVGFVGFGLFSLARRFMFGSAADTQAPVVRDLPRADPYYDAAMRELDSELRHTTR